MRILLIYPWFTNEYRTIRCYPVEPLGLLSLATYLERHNFWTDDLVQIYDAHLEGPPYVQRVERGLRSGATNLELLQKLTDFAPNVIGITCNYTVTVGDALEVAALCKARVPHAKIVLGGAHATIAHRDLIRLDCVDYVVRGEGEQPFYDLCTMIRSQLWSAADAVLGTTSKRRVNPDALPLNMDLLPYPKRSLLADYRRYLNYRGYSWPKQEPIATLSTSRGCPFRCIFCSTQKVWGNKWRSRSVESIISEMDECIGLYGIKEFAFQDDQFMGDCERVKELCRQIIRRKWGVTLLAPPGISPALLDHETLRLMRDAGFYRICFSIDVGTNKAQKYVKKPVKLEKMRELVRYANHIGLYTYGTFVIGFPDENRTDIEEATRFAWSLKMDHVIFYIAQPHLGSDLYDEFTKMRWIEQQKGQIDPDHAHYGTKHLTGTELESLRDIAQKRYPKYHLLHHVFNPIYFVSELLPKIVHDPRYFARMVWKFIVDNP